MVIDFLCREHCKSQEDVFKRFASLQATHGRSVIRAMATTKREVSASSLCWSSYVIYQFLIYYSEVRSTRALLMRLKSSTNGCKGSSFEREYYCYLLEARKEINDHFEVIGTIVVVFVSYR